MAALFLAFAMAAAPEAAAQIGANAPARPQAGPPAPARPAEPPLRAPRDGPLPLILTLERALEEAEARSPALVAARAEVEAAAALVRQAGFRSNPELSVDVENFAGTGELSRFRATETTVAVNQPLDLGGRRRARVGAAQAELAMRQLQLAITRADLAQAVHEQFARAVAARARVQLAEESDARAQELARIAAELVAAGREPPLRALRARSAAAEAAVELETARAEERAARALLAALFGVGTPVGAVAGAMPDREPGTVDPEQSLDVRLAEAQQVAAEAALRQELTVRRLDPAVGVGVRHLAATGDVALVGGVSMPLPVFDRNQGNIAAARANVTAAQARRASALATATVRARNAAANVEVARARVNALERAALPEAAEALRLAQIAYREGRASLVELLDVQEAYISAQAALTEARLALALATAELGRIAAQ